MCTARSRFTSDGLLSANKVMRSSIDSLDTLLLSKLSIGSLLPVHTICSCVVDPFLPTIRLILPAQGLKTNSTG